MWLQKLVVDAKVGQVELVGGLGILRHRLDLLRLDLEKVGRALHHGLELMFSGHVDTNLQL